MYDNPYAPLKAAIRDRLTTAAGTPFKASAVAAYGQELSEAETVEELQRMQSIAPAALIIDPGGEGNRGLGQELEDTAQICVVVVAAGASREAAHAGDAARWGLDELKYWVIRHLHGYQATGIANALRWVQRRPFVLPHTSLGVAAEAINFETLIRFSV